MSDSTPQPERRATGGRRWVGVPGRLIGLHRPQGTSTQTTTLPADAHAAAWLTRLAPWFLTAGLVLFHAVNNWLWLAANVTLLGWDVPSHLGTSFVYDSILRPVTSKTLFTAITWHPNRPPLYFLSAVPLYRLFGLSADVGTMINLFYLAMLFGSVYNIGRRLGGAKVGLLAEFVVATFPMIYAISRYFYVELALTAMVALSICLLLASEQFERRSASMLFGLSLGLGLLTKRTYPAFLVAPVCVVVARSQVIVSLRRRLENRPRVHVRDALLALGLGLALAMAWYLPAREVASHLPLGRWLVPLWVILILVTVYLMRREPGPDTNLLSALSLGVTIGSLWFLPRITFIERLLRFGFGVNDPWERTPNLDDAATYTYFLVRLVNEHISLVYFVLLIVAGLALLLALRRKGRIWPTLRKTSDAWWATVLWAMGSYLLFTISVYRKSRGIAPVLPALALILAAGLVRLRWRKAASLLLVAFVIAWGLLQFFVVSYGVPHWLAQGTAVTLPILGDTGPFAHGGTLQLPAADQTDPGYWVVPDVLRMIDADRQAADVESFRLGVLVNNEHVNPDLLGLIALQSYPGIGVRNLARSGIPDSIYTHLFEYDYLLLTEHNYKWIDAAAEEALRRLGQAPEFFDATFELAQRFPLPDGDTVLLYRKTQRLSSAYDANDYRTAAQFLTAWAEADDALLLMPPEQIEALGQMYDGYLVPYLLPEEQPLDQDRTVQVLQQAADRHPVLFVLFRDESTADPERFVEGWLNEHAYRGPTEWHGAVRLVAYGSAPLVEETVRPLDVGLGGEIRLMGYGLAENSVRPGRMVRLALFWYAEEPVTDRLTVFAHLVDGDGRLVAQQDSEPVGGSRPTSTWEAGESIRDPVGILIPPDVPDGDLHLVVGLYEPTSGERLPVRDGVAAVSGDSFVLGKIQLTR